MPRKRQTQAVAVPTGMPYGQGEKLADAQRQMPLPTGSSPAAAGAGAAPSAPAPAPADPMAAAIAAAQQMAPPDSSLAAPGDPSIPITAGLRAGAGAGPEALGLPAIPEDDDALNQLIYVYNVTGSPAVERLIHVVKNRAEHRARMLARGQAGLDRRQRFQ